MQQIGCRHESNQRPLTGLTALILYVGRMIYQMIFRGAPDIMFFTRRPK